MKKLALQLRYLTYKASIISYVNSRFGIEYESLLFTRFKFLWVYLHPTFSHFIKTFHHLSYRLLKIWFSNRKHVTSEKNKFIVMVATYLRFP